MSLTQEGRHQWWSWTRLELTVREWIPIVRWRMLVNSSQIFLKHCLPLETFSLQLNFLQLAQSLLQVILGR